MLPSCASKCSVARLLFLASHTFAKHRGKGGGGGGIPDCMRQPDRPSVPCPPVRSSNAPTAWTTACACPSNGQRSSSWSTPVLVPASSKPQLSPFLVPELPR